jgi:hypothetical protein
MTEYLVEDLIVIWTIIGLTVATIVLVLYFTIRDIILSSRRIFVLRDQYTVFFIAFIIIGLFFKVLLLDTYYKNEL